MSKAKMISNPKKMTSCPGTNFWRPSGAASFATSNDPNLLAYSIQNVNRATRRLAQQKLGSKKYDDFIKQNRLFK